MLCVWRTGLSYIDFKSKSEFFPTSKYYVVLGCKKNKKKLSQKCIIELEKEGIDVCVCLFVCGHHHIKIILWIKQLYFKIKGLK